MGKVVHSRAFVVSMDFLDMKSDIVGKCMRNNIIQAELTISNYNINLGCQDISASYAFKVSLGLKIKGMLFRKGLVILCTLNNSRNLGISFADSGEFIFFPCFSDRFFKRSLTPA